MKKLMYLILLIGFASIGITTKSFAQDISVFQYRHVPGDKIDEFLHRETTYWSEVARKGVDKGNLITWALFQKVGGFDLPNSSNFLFINTFKDINSANMSEIWNASAVFPDVPMDAMETNSLSTVTSQLFVRPDNFEASPNANPPQDFNFIKINYWDSSNPNDFIAIEKEHWVPFIKGEMAKSGVSQVGWGNATILSPRGPDMKAQTMSFDIYPTIKDALIPSWSDGVTFPEEGLTKLNEITNNRTEVLYRIVKVVAAN